MSRPSSAARDPQRELFDSARVLGGGSLLIVAAARKTEKALVLP